MKITSPLSVQPIILVILDGFGISRYHKNNAVFLARTPVMDQLHSTYPHSLLQASGEDVGLPKGQMGNSEVGHVNLGAGRIVMQDLPRISKAFQEGQVADLPVLQTLIKTVKKTGGRCHLLGLLSPGGVHSHMDHILALSKILVDAHVPVLIHAFTDGRDTAPQSAQRYIKEFSRSLPKGAHIVTVTGRYYGMDRDNRWERIEKAYNALVNAKGTTTSNFDDSLVSSYENGITDEFLEPYVMCGYDGMLDGDAMIACNFRADRTRQILNSLLNDDFDGFHRNRHVHFCSVAGFTYYSDLLAKKIAVIFPQEKLNNLLGDIIACSGLKQARLAETEKYPHVTYFFNGGREKPVVGEDRFLIPSPKITTYDLQPEMSALELTDKVLEVIESKRYSLTIVNFANPDMVGHTGVLSAAIKAVEVTDTCLGRIKASVIRNKITLLITADHGNCETMRDPETGEPHTAHTCNEVPLLMVNAKGFQLQHQGRLSDVAPTILSLMSLPIPIEMTGQNLLIPCDKGTR